MSEIQNVEIERHRKQIHKDMQHLFDKYVRMMDWDVPENDEANARRLIIQAMKQALGDVESQV